MSFCIAYKLVNDVWEDFSVVESRQTPSPLVISRDSKSLYIGEAFDITSEELFDLDWEKNPNVLNNYCSAIAIIRHDATKCSFATDTTGRELIFIYSSPHLFLLADSFWEICKRVQPRYSDIDSDVLKEIIAAGGGVPSDHKTPLRGCSWVGPNMFGEFDCADGTLNLRRFKDIRRSGEVKNLNDAVEGMDEAMNYMAESLIERFPSEVFGLGLSGGLDSRVALHYLLKHGAKLECFNTCTTRPHKLLLANSVSKARALAACSNVSYREVEWLPEKIRSKMNKMLIGQPLGTGGHYTNAYKYEEDYMPRFDILVTAGQAIGPYLVGVSAPKNSKTMSRSKVLSSLMQLTYASAQPYSFTEHSIRKQLNKMLPITLDSKLGPNNELWSRIVNDKTNARIASKVATFVDDRLEKGYQPADITLDFRTTTLGAIGRNGAYESRFGDVRSFTIYTPFLVKEGLKWDIPLIEDRRILKELIKRKIPEFASIGEEEVGSVGQARSSTIFLNKLEFVLRGSGIMAEEWYRNNQYIREAFIEDMVNECEWFYAMIPAAKDIEGVWAFSPARRNSVWEVKRLVDCLERKTYCEFKC